MAKRFPAHKNIFHPFDKEEVKRSVMRFLEDEVMNKGNGALFDANQPPTKKGREASSYDKLFGVSMEANNSSIIQLFNQDGSTELEV